MQGNVYGVGSLQHEEKKTDRASELEEKKENKGATLDELGGRVHRPGDM